jgi:ATP-dependent RNA helicase DDX18/HAS1
MRPAGNLPVKVDIQERHQPRPIRSSQTGDIAILQGRPTSVKVGLAGAQLSQSLPRISCRRGTAIQYCLKVRRWIRGKWGTQSIRGERVSRHSVADEVGIGSLSKFVRMCDDLDAARGVEGTLVETIRFDRLAVSQALKKALRTHGFSEMRPIQARAIPHLLAGRSVLGASPTGTGKTLAFLVPAIELLTFSRSRPSHGMMVLILSPARELALQTFQLATALMKDISPTVMAVVGGQKGFRDEEYVFRNRGVNMVVATPGRIRRHLEGGVVGMDSFQMMIIDEADRILEEGFDSDLYAIFGLVPRPRQLALFSATLTPAIEGLMNLNMREPPVFCCVGEHVERLEHLYAVVAWGDRLAVLLGVIERLVGKRVVVFVSNRKEGEFLARVAGVVGIECDLLQGELSQAQRTQAFVRFSAGRSNLLFATNVAARGLDFPDVAWSVSLGPPDRVRTYVHRAGRTARNGAEGRSLLLVAPNEFCFIEDLARVSITARRVRLNVDVAGSQARVADALAHCPDLVALAGEALAGFRNSYQARPPQGGISVADVDEEGLQRSFGLF